MIFRPTGRRQHPRRMLAVPAVLMAAMALASCASNPVATSTTSGTPGASASATWPRTVKVGDQQITVKAQPKRVVALSTETSDLALELVGASRLVGISEGSKLPGTGNQLEQAKQVGTVFKTQVDPEPEQILSLNADLVIMTARHEGEQGLAKVLAKSNVPTAAFASDAFATPDDVIASVTTLGQLLGASDKAQTIAQTIRDQVNKVSDQAAANPGNKPRTLVLMQRGGKVLLMPATSTTNQLVAMAGGSPIAVENNWKSAIPAGPEAIVAAKPDVILVQDFRGEGMKPFESLLANPALAQVPAVANQRVRLVDAATTSGTAGSRIGEGLGQIADILHTK